MEEESSKVYEDEDRASRQTPDVRTLRLEVQSCRWAGLQVAKTQMTLF